MSDMRELSPKPLSAELMVGAVSPLWGFFAGAAATGVAFWWASQWARPTNLEPLFGKRLSAPSPELAPALPASDDPQAVTEPATAVALKAMEPMLAAVEVVEVEVADLAAQAEALAEPMVEAVAAAEVPAIAETPVAEVAAAEPARPRRKAAAPGETPAEPSPE
jgi:hypothetical protein